MDLLITEAQLNGLINEGIGGYLYYYRSPASLLDILRTNRVRASVAGFFNSESAYWETKFNKGRFFFLSTTRNKLFRFMGRNCRIYLDENKLRQRYKVVPIETLSGVKEYEERVLLNKSFIIASDYILRVDFFVPTIHEEYVEEIDKLSKEMGIPVYFFKNEPAFLKGDESKDINPKHIIKKYHRNIPIKKYKPISEFDLKYFLFIFQIGSDRGGIIDYLDDSTIRNMSMLPFDANRFERIVGEMLVNPDYHFLLQTLADRMKRDKVVNIGDFFSVQRSRYDIENYVSNGSKGNLKLEKTKLKSLKPLVEVGGNFNFSFSRELEVLDSIKEVGGICDMSFCSNLKSLGTLEKVGGHLHLHTCYNLRGFGSLKFVGGSLSVNQCTKLKNLDGIEHVGGYIYLSGSALMLDAQSGELQKKYPHLADKFYF